MENTFLFAVCWAVQHALKVSAFGVVPPKNCLISPYEWSTNGAAGTEETEPFVSDGCGCSFLEKQNKKRPPLLQQKQRHSVLERQEEISQREIRSLSLARSTGAAGAFITKLIAFATTEGRNWGEISQKASQTQAKLSTVESKEWKDAPQQLNMVYYFWVCLLVEPQDKRLSIMVYVCNLRIPLWPGTICSAFTSSGAQRRCQGTNFLLPSWIRISFIFLCTHS